MPKLLNLKTSNCQGIKDLLNTTELLTKIENYVCHIVITEHKIRVKLDEVQTTKTHFRRFTRQ